MTTTDLRRRAEARGVATVYRDWRGRPVEVGEDTLAAILAAMGAEPMARPQRPLAPGGRSPSPPPPPGRTWGFAVQLYALRSRRSWGHGDLRDLADLADWSGRALGAGFVLVNPLHAAEPVPPVSPSPYLPMSRKFVSPLYLRIEDLPECQALPAAERARIRALSAPLRVRSTSSELIDRDTIWSAKLAALEIVRTQPATPQRLTAFARFRVREGQALSDWATWCALAEQYGPDWRRWPARLRAIGSDDVARERERLRARVDFHAWLAWLADEQLAAAQAAARAAGMRVGIITDLAVGAHPGGADAWADADVLVPGVSVGAPPDEFNQLGQDWGQPPWHPERLSAVGCRPLARLMQAGFRHAGGLRVDHVMGLFRLWWVPEGMPAAKGAYVRYDHQATTGALTGEAARVGALAIGEDLGTVEPWVRDYLRARGVLGTSMLWFERDEAGLPLPPAQWRRSCLATVGTHDVPPAAAFATGEQVELRGQLGLLARPVEAERAEASAALAAWRAALRAEGMETDPAGDPAGFTLALYRYLARTPAALVAVSLADAAGDRRPQNMPGTTSEYPNWRVPLCDGEGRAVLLDDLADLPQVTCLARAVGVPGTAP